MTAERFFVFLVEKIKKNHYGKKLFAIQVCFIIETGKETALLREKEAKRRFRRAKISGLEELIYTIIFLFFVCFIGIIILACSFE